MTTLAKCTLCDGLLICASCSAITTEEPTDNIKIALNERDFRCLVRGGELTIEDVSCRVILILNDIGAVEMGQAVHDSFVGKVDQYVPYTRPNDWRPYDKKRKS